MLTKRKDVLSKIKPFHRERLSLDSARVTFNIACKTKNSGRIADRTTRVLHQLNKLNRNCYDKNISGAFDVVNNPFHRGIVSLFLLARKLFVRAQHTYETWKNLPLSNEEDLMKITKEDLDLVRDIEKSNSRSDILSPKHKLVFICRHYVSKPRCFNIPHFNTDEFSKDLNIVFYTFALYLYRDNCLSDYRSIFYSRVYNLILTYETKMEAVDRKAPGNYGSTAWTVLSKIICRESSSFVFNVYNLRNLINMCKSPNLDPVEETIKARDKMTEEEKTKSVQFGKTGYDRVDTTNVEKFRASLAYDPIEFLSETICDNRQIGRRKAPVVSKKISID